MQSVSVLQLRVQMKSEESLNPSNLSFKAIKVTEGVKYFRSINIPRGITTFLVMELLTGVVETDLVSFALSLATDYLVSLFLSNVTYCYLIAKDISY